MPGGGTTFGPQPRSYVQSLPKKVRKQALCVALTQKCREEKLFVFEEGKLDQPKTKTMQALLAKLKVEKALFVGSENENLYRSVRNLKKAKYIDVQGLNVFDILKYDFLFLSSTSLKKIEERLSA